jgi:hypothetical protein
MNQEIPIKKKRNKTKYIGTFTLETKKVRVWLEGNVINFRKKRHRLVHTISLNDAYTAAVGQFNFPFYQSTATGGSATGVVETGDSIPPKPEGGEVGVGISADRPESLPGSGDVGDCPACGGDGCAGGK